MSYVTELPSARWFDAAQHRRSRRTYAEGGDAAALAALGESCRLFRPFPDARVELVLEPRANVFGGIRGSYGTIRGATSVLVFICSTKSPFAQRHIGYVGEGIVLEATALGLGTCWVGGFFDRRRATALTPLDPTERVVAVSPVGIPAEDLALTERTMRSAASSDRRKPLNEIAPASTEWPAWALGAVEAARIAPSASNRQPWRFAMSEGALTASLDSAREVPLVAKRLDIGIACLHAELGAARHGVNGVWQDAEQRTGSLEVTRFVLSSGTT
jgi:nitroreductase